VEIDVDWGKTVDDDEDDEVDDGNFAKTWVFDFDETERSCFLLTALEALSNLDGKMSSFGAQYGS
jgi:hypothetical protein